MAQVVKIGWDSWRRTPPEPIRIISLKACVGGVIPREETYVKAENSLL